MRMLVRKVSVLTGSTMGLSRNSARVTTSQNLRNAEKGFR